MIKFTCQNFSICKMARAFTNFKVFMKRYLCAGFRTLLLLVFILPFHAVATPEETVTKVQPIAQAQFKTIESPQELLEYRAHAVLRVGDINTVSNQLVQKVEKVGGWFLRWENFSVEFRLPVAYLRPILDSLVRYGQVEDRGFQTRDPAMELAELQAQEKARAQLLDEYFAMLRTLRDNRLQVVERQMVDLHAQLETLRGQIRAVEQRSQFAFLRIDFQMLDRNPLPLAESPFTWIRNLHLHQLQGDFQ